MCKELGKDSLDDDETREAYRRAAADKRAKAMPGNASAPAAPEGGAPKPAADAAIALDEAAITTKAREGYVLAVDHVTVVAATQLATDAAAAVHALFAARDIVADKVGLIALDGADAPKNVEAIYRKACDILKIEHATVAADALPAFYKAATAATVTTDAAPAAPFNVVSLIPAPRQHPQRLSHMSLTRNGFQSFVNTNNPPGNIGDFASMNPRAVVVAGPGALKVGSGRHRRLLRSRQSHDSGSRRAISRAAGILGFVANETQALITAFLGQSNLVLTRPATRSRCTRTATFWTVVAGRPVTVGATIYAVAATGQPTTDDASGANYDTGFKAVTAAPATRPPSRARSPPIPAC
jgi:hypothetical protein